MKSGTHKPPVGEPWVWMTRELLSSDAWRTASVNARRVVDFLLLEHMRQGGRANGKLKAPYRQLLAFGIGARFINAYIREAEELGLIDCHRGGLRVATVYGLTWLPTAEAPASNVWRCYRNPALPPLPQPKSKNLPAKGDAALPAKGDADRVNLPAKGDADSPKNLPAKGDAPYRKDSYQGGDDNKDLEVGDRRAPLRVVG